MNKYTNISSCSPLLAPWLVHDDYDHNPDPYTISVTTLLKPIKMIILGSRVGEQSYQEPVDVFSKVPSKVGSAVHDSVEHLWKDSEKLHKALLSINTPQPIIDAIKVNPDPSTVTEDDIPVYLEQRVEKQVGRWKVSGKFDAIFNGSVRDIKTTGTYTYTNKTNDDDYIKQGSCYRWLNPKIVTDDIMYIDYLFKDWKPSELRNPNYPRSAHVPKSFQLEPYQVTDNWIKAKLAKLETLWDSLEEALPQCSTEDLWQGDSTWKYYAKGYTEGSRATKVFTHPSDAFAHKAAQGKGEVREVKGTIKRCKYCPALPLCQQGKNYFAQGLIK